MIFFFFRFLKCFKYYGGKIKECGHAYLSQISRVASIHYWSKFVKTKVSNAASAGNSRSKATYLTYSNSLSKHGFEQSSLQELFYLHELILSLSVLFRFVPSHPLSFCLVPLVNNTITQVNFLRLCNSRTCCMYKTLL